RRLDARGQSRGDAPPEGALEPGQGGRRRRPRRRPLSGWIAERSRDRAHDRWRPPVSPGARASAALQRRPVLRPVGQRPHGHACTRPGSSAVGLWLLSRILPPAGGDGGRPRPAWPDVSILLSAYNEERVIGDRVRNLLELDYPVEHLEILVGSDGSTDRTCEVVAGFGAPGLRLIAFDR